MVSNAACQPFVNSTEYAVGDYRRQCPPFIKHSIDYIEDLKPDLIFFLFKQVVFCIIHIFFIQLFLLILYLSTSCTISAFLFQANLRCGEANWQYWNGWTNDKYAEDNWPLIFSNQSNSNTNAIASFKQVSKNSSVPKKLRITKVFV